MVLVDRSVNFIARKGSDDAFNLPPVAKAHHIAIVATALGTRRGLESGIIAIASDEVRSVSKGEASVDEGLCHAAHVHRARFATADRRRQYGVDHILMASR